VPLDDFAPEAAWRMEVVGDPGTEQPIFDEFRRIIAGREGTRFHLPALERFAFYERARGAFAIIATAGRRQTSSQAAADEALSSSASCGKVDPVFRTERCAA
jgi:L-fucose mutarotase/ribose pyranase (RbsD/FucU family)